MTARLRSLVAAGATALVCTATACTGLPTAGPVIRESDVGTSLSDTSSYFMPPGPEEGATPNGIVRGFLLAMQATPVSVAVARQFLTEDAADAWQPERRTLVYEGLPITETEKGIRLDVDGAIALDDRGRWLGPQESAPLNLGLVREEGEWRLSTPPDALMVPSSYFADRFTRASLGFYDPSARTLVPEPVHFPLGPQGATALTRALLRGPLAPRATRSFAPSGTTVDLSVSVSSTGLAEVPVSAQVLNLSRRELSRLAVQLSYTLAQVEGIDRIRLTVDGAPVATGASGDSIPIDLAGTQDPSYASAGGRLYAVQDGRLARLVGSQVRDLGEPWASTPTSMREAAVSLDGAQAATVSADGRSLLLAPLLTGDAGTSSQEDPEPSDEPAPDEASSAAQVAAVAPVASGRDVRELGWTRFGELWSLAGGSGDRGGRGATVQVTVDGRTRSVQIPGVSGRQVSTMLISRDGSRLIAAVGSEPSRGQDRQISDDAPRAQGEKLVVARVSRDEVGALDAVLPARPLPLLGGLLADGTTDVIDLAWTDATEIALLIRPQDGAARVERVAIDGSPVAVDALSLSAPPEGARQLVASPDPESGIRLLTRDGQVFQLAASGSWVRLPVPLLDALTWVG